MTDAINGQFPPLPEGFDAQRLQIVYDRILKAAAENGDDLDRLAQSLSEIIAETLGDLCSIQVLNRDNEKVHLAGMHDADPRALSLLADAVAAMAEMPRDEGAVGQVLLTGEPLFLPSIPEDALRSVGVPEFVRYIDAVGMSSAMAVALKGSTGNFGAITLSRHRGHPAYTDTDLRLLLRMSRQVASALEHAVLVESLRRQLAGANSERERMRQTEARTRMAFDRILKAARENGDDIDALAQALSVVVAETFRGLSSITLLNQHNELMHIGGLHDVDPRALSMLKDFLASAKDVGRDEGLTAQVIRTGQPLLMRSVPQETLDSIPYPGMQEYIREVGFGTAMSVALKGRSNNFGAVSVARPRGAQPFSEADLELLEAMSSRMSIFFENMLQVENLRFQLAAASIQQDEAARADPRAVFDRMMRAIVELGGDADGLAQEFSVITAETIGDLCTIVLRNPHNEMLHIAGQYDAEPKALALIREAGMPSGFLPRGNSIVSAVLRTGQPVLRPSITEAELRAFILPEFSPYLEQVGVQSLMAVPIRGRDHDIGTVSLYRHRGGRPYDEADLGLLTDMALCMQVALDNLLRAESLRDQQSVTVDRPPELEDVNRLAVLHHLTHMIGENRQHIDRMMELAAVIAAESLGGTCSITLLNRNNQRMNLAAYYDTDRQALSLLGDVLKATASMPRGTGLLADVMRSDEARLIPSLDEAQTGEQVRAAGIPELTRYWDEIGISSVVAAPLGGMSGVVGGISLARHRGEAPYTEADRDFLVEIAYRLAIGVENYGLIESLRKEIAATSSTQQALHASELRFRSVFDSTALGIEVMDASGFIVDVNRAFESMSGYSWGEMVGRPYGTLQHADDSGSFLRMMTELKMSRESGAPVENRIIGKDGTQLWVKTHLAAVKKPDEDAISLIVAMHENITGRKQAEQYFQAVLEATPDGLVMVDAEGRIMLVNQQLQSMFGYQREDVVGQHIETLVPERLRSEHPLHRASYLMEPHMRSMGEGLELFGVRKDGTEFPVEVSLSSLEINGAMVVVAAIRDVTDRRKRQAALVRSERSLSEAQQVARLGSLEFDVLTGGIDASEEALRILGVERAELRTSESVLERMHPEDRQRVREQTQSVLQTRVPAEFEFRVLLPDGSERIVHDRVAPFFDPHGKPTRILGTIQDVTELRQTERDMNELKNHLQSSVELERLRLAQDLHDGPMQELYGASYRLDELGDSADEDLKDGIEEVSDQIQGTIDELRSIAKELRPPSISSFGLEKAIRSYAEDFEQKHSNIALRLSLARDHQLLPETIRLTLFRVFQQALANVLRHSQATEVSVRFALDAEEARLVISDNGQGFVVPANWMSFVRGGHYGLAGAAERLNALGGMLLVESHPQQSTTITAVVPWSRAAQNTKASADKVEG
ncbi:MAG TPA: PAS domain S-box protein [Anaerolineales bacterium]|nr:PAS domain S-box protein [Anaerolineales bacterium]